jgi:hypothetical protein
MDAGWSFAVEEICHRKDGLGSNGKFPEFSSRSTLKRQDVVLNQLKLYFYHINSLIWISCIKFAIN